MPFDAIEYINTPRWLTSRLGLERIRELLDRLGRPQDRLKFVHVAGTNGKGSTCAFTASILAEAGFKTGLFTSPYVETFHERIRVNGRNISDEDLTAATLRVRECAEAMEAEGGEHPTEFELMTAVALVHFAHAGCDIVVLEVGLGGRLDSTNVIAAPEVAAIVSIALDHTNLLGNTLAEIAHEKAGIVKAGSTVVSWPQEPSAMEVVEDAVRRVGDKLVVPDFSMLSVGKVVGGAALLTCGTALEHEGHAPCSDSPRCAAELRAEHAAPTQKLQASSSIDAGFGGRMPRAVPHEPNVPSGTFVRAQDCLSTEVPPHALERTGQLNSWHSHESQPEQPSLVRRVPESAVIVMMPAVAVVILVVAVIVIIVNALTICFLSTRPIEAVLGAFGFLAVDQRQGRRRLERAPDHLEQLDEVHRRFRLRENKICVVGARKRRLQFGEEHLGSERAHEALLANDLEHALGGLGEPGHLDVGEAVTEGGAMGRVHKRVRLNRGNNRRRFLQRANGAHELGRSRSAALHRAPRHRVEQHLRRTDRVFLAGDVAHDVLSLEGTRVEHVLQGNRRLDEPEVAHRGDRAELARETRRRCGEVDEHRPGIRRLNEPAFVEVRILKRRLRGAEGDDGGGIVDVDAALEAGVRQAHGDLVVKILVSQKYVAH